MTRKTLSSEEWTKLILGLTLALGLLVRVFPAVLSGFPLNDGGMFLVMIEELQDSRLALPAFTDYNYFGIPFAYPPFGLYVAAILGLLGLDEVFLLRWLPILINFLSIPGFFLMARALLGDQPKAAVATVFFALTPGSYVWQIMGGGVTRAFGVAFFVLAIWAMARMYRSADFNYPALAALFCSLAVLSHPQIALETVAIGALLWVFNGRSRAGVVRAASVAAGTVLLTSIWWGTVLANHGAAPFLSAMHSGGYAESPLRRLLVELISPAKVFSISGLLRIAGLVWCIRRREWFLPAWLVMPFFAEERGADAIAFFPSCLLVAIGLIDALPILVARLRRRSAAEATPADRARPAWLDPAVILMMLVLFIGSALYDFRLVNTTLIPPHPQQAFDWVRAETPRESRFLVLTGFSGIMSDPLQEWFPALASRRSQTTLQGLEWTLAADFFPRLRGLIDLQECANAQCVDAWAEGTSLDYTHVMIPLTEDASDLLRSYESDDRFSVVYENPELVIFQR